MKKNKEDIFLITFLSLLSAFSLCWGHSLSLLIVFFLIIEGVLYFLWDKFDKFQFKKNTPIKKYEWVLFGTLIFLTLMVALFAYYPGYASPDSCVQWNQVQTGRYGNWHPVLHTLFAFKLPSLFYNHILSCTLFQMAIIFSILLYFCYFCRKNFLSFPLTLFVLLTILLNPLFFMYSVTLWKDITFSWFLFLGTLFLINIAITNGNWLKKNRNKIVFLLVSFGILVFRHNGLIPFVSMFLFLILFYPQVRKFASLAFLSLLACNFLITGPVFSYFSIDSKTGGKAEMVGMVMGNISYYYNNNVEFSKEELETLDEIIPLKNWQEKYDPTDFNPIKYSGVNYNGRVKERFNEIMKIWAKYSLKHPVYFLNSFLNISSPIWKTDYYFQGIDYYVKDYQTSVTQKGKLENISNKFLNYLVNYYSVATVSPLRIVLINIGQGLLFTIYALIFAFKVAKKNWKKYLPFVLTLSNSFAMMLLITGKECRFVYYQSLCALALLIYSLSVYVKKIEL